MDKSTEEIITEMFDTMRVMEAQLDLLGRLLVLLKSHIEGQSKIERS